MGLFSNPAGTALVVNDSQEPIDCTACPCDHEGPCPAHCDGGGDDEYTVTFFGGTLTNESCVDCADVLDTPYVLTYGIPDCVGGDTCCWGYSDVACELVVLLLVQDELVILTVRIGAAIEAQWVWDRGADPDTCAAGIISSNIAWDTGDEIQCSGWIDLSVSVE